MDAPFRYFSLPRETLLPIYKRTYFRLRVCIVYPSYKTDDCSFTIVARNVGSPDGPFQLIQREARKSSEFTPSDIPRFR